MTMPRMPNMAQTDVERVRGYLVAQANKLSLPELVAKVRADTSPLKDVVGSVPPDRFRERPGAEDWSAAEVMTHVLAMNEHGAQAIESILDRGVAAPRIEDRLQHEEREELKTAADYWRVFEARREQLYGRILTARGNEHLDVMIQHPLFGPLNWREWFLFMRIHDLDHMRQIEAIAARGV